jgi:hypothetical protein
MRQIMYALNGRATNAEGGATMDVPTLRVRQPTHIVEMMQRLGIEPGGGAVSQLCLSYATAFHRCEACSSKPACREWLDSTPQSANFAPHFCPSADILFELQVDQPSHNHTPIPKKAHTHITDLERLEDEIDEILIRESTDNLSILNLKRRRLHLRAEIEWLRREAVTKSRTH